MHEREQKALDRGVFRSVLMDYCPWYLIIMQGNPAGEGKEGDRDSRSELFIGGRIHTAVTRAMKVK